MKDFVLVEFMCVGSEALELSEKIRELAAGFEFERSDISEEVDEDDRYMEYLHVWGKISSEAASFIRLQDQFLSERMRISTIPDELKDKYRTRK